jgi:Peptidase family M48
MRRFTILLVVLVFGSLPLCAQQPASALDQVLDRIVAREKDEVQFIRSHSPMVETYVQLLAPDKALGMVPKGDKYFLGRAKLENGVQLVSLADEEGKNGQKGFLGGLFSSSMEFIPEGFLQMVFLDADGFDRQNYQFDYVRREFLGEVRALVFDVTPKNKSDQGRFAGRVWVEDQDFHIVRFNGAYTGSKRDNLYFHFDSWRVNTGKSTWVPALIYSEENDIRFALSKKVRFKAQTRLWGYNIGQAKQEQELSKILIEADLPVSDQADAAKDISPLQAQRSWDRQAEDNVVDRMERLGLLAPSGEVDKVLETVVNNLEVTNNLDVQPEIRCRVVITSTLEAFTIGHTIVLSRGLIDVLPDEASLAAVISHELAHTVLGHRIDTQYAFFDRMLFDDQETFNHFGFARTPDEEVAANAKAAELLANSPYKDQLATAQRFVAALEARSKQIPNLISPHLGNDVLTRWTPGALPAHSAPADPNAIVALPLGGRIKLDPWNDELTMLNAKPVGAVAEREKMPFEVTPFILYLTRDEASISQQTPGAVSAQSKTDPNSSPTEPR